MPGGGSSVEVEPAARSWYEPRLDELRFAAFLLVFASHNLDVSTFAPSWLRSTLPSFTTLGLVLFFVLSAFLLTRLMEIEVEERGAVDVRRYFLRRIRRIWPLYFAVLGGAVAVAALLAASPAVAERATVDPGNVIAFDEVPSFVLFVANWYLPLTDSVSNFLPHLWSLSVEEQFYVVLPFVYALARRRGQVALAWMVAAGVAAGAATVAAGASPRLVSTATTTYAASFAAGMLLGRCRDLRAPWRGSSRPIVVVATVAFLVAWPVFEDAGGYALLVAVCLATVLAVVWIVLLTGEHPPPGSLRRSCQWLGKRGYGLYVFHWIVLQVVVQVPALAPSGRVTPFGVVLSFAATVAVSAVSYGAFEIRFLAWRREAERARLAV